ncbi:MAG: cupin domain-containing protein [Candidatus Marinimicrobia bacterium]|nr:cupin domain-containing protein [Candidatus Neomarinimicrobiota bacterium]
MIIRPLSKVPSARVEMEGVKGAFRQVPIGRAEGTPHFSVRVFTLEPAGHTPYHAHESEHVNYIISGSGFLVDEKGNEHPITRGDFCLVSPWEKHQFKNDSPEHDLVFICAVMKEFE